jgi:dTDP-4-amino-4,6-dideoxygalactose transaminase
VHAIVHAGLQPVLADVNAQTLMPDANTVADAIGVCGPVDAMVVIHFGGAPAPVEELAVAAGLPLGRVVEDAAHAIGTRVGDRVVGTISAATCFSFYATKNLPIGEGGMITTADHELAHHASQARLHGMSHDAWKRYLPGSSWRYDVDVAGIKANMTDLYAAIGRGQMPYLAPWQSRREKLARDYDQRLSRLEGLRTPHWPERGQHAWHLYVVQVGRRFGVDRDTLIRRLSERGVDCSVHFIPIHHQSYFQRLLESPAIRELPVADAVFEQIVSLPLYPGMTDDMLDRVCEEIEAVQRSAAGTLHGRPEAEG